MNSGVLLQRPNLFKRNPQATPFSLGKSIPYSGIQTRNRKSLVDLSSVFGAVVLSFIVSDSVRPSPSVSTSVLRRKNSIAMPFEDHPIRGFALLSAAYLLAVLTLSRNKVLWLDELITLHIAQLGSVSAIWNALARAADPNPPLTHLAVLASLRIFGVHELALRLPAILGYWIGLLSLFLFLKQRVPVAWALTGIVLAMSNASFDYSYESRSYGIFYGFAILATLCWIYAIDPALPSIQRRFALCGMTLALAAGICTNYFAVLAFFPIAGGELVRSFTRPRLSPRSFYPPVWIALVIASTPLLLFRGLIQTSIAHFAPHAWNKVSLDQVFDSYTGMVEVILFPVVSLLALLSATCLLARLCAHCRNGLRPRWLSNLANHHACHSFSALPLHERAAVLLFLLYPFLGYIIASIHGGMLSPRFVMPVCIGFAITGAVVGYRIFGHLRHAGAVGLLLCSVVFTGRVCAVGEAYSQQKQCFYQVLQSLPKASDNKPIVVPDPLMVLTLAHYAPAPIASRIVFPVDFPAIRLFRGEDSPEENLWAGRDLYHLTILPLADFQRNAADYLIVASEGNWLVRDLGNHSYPVHRLPIPYPTGVIKGFTPLDHGDPVLFLGSGDRSDRTHHRPNPVPFHSNDNLPNSPSLAASSKL